MMGPRSADSGGGEIPGGGLSQYEDTALARVNALLPEMRIAQQMMFEAVLRGENHIEAPCGLGKTALAGLLLAAQPLTWAGRLFVATSTRAQAEQAYGFAQEMVTAELADEAHLLLGAEQYLCNDRRQANGLQPLSGGTMRHEFPQEKDWSRSSHDPECCDANECMDDCYYEARARVVDARRAVVVVTHARAVYEHRFGTLKTHPGDLLLVDEAHNVPGALRQHMGCDLRAVTLHNLHRQHPRAGFKRAGVLLDSVLHSVHIDPKDGWAEVTGTPLTDVLTAVEAIRAATKKAEKAKSRRETELRLANDPSMLRWVEEDDRGRRVLMVRDPDTAGNFTDLARGYGRVVTMSATLDGLPAADLGVTVWQAPAEFDVAGNRTEALMPAVDDEDAVRKAVEAVVAHGGRALVLAKSSNIEVGGRSVRQIDALADALKDAGLRVGVQQGTHSVPKLAGDLRAGRVDVLVGLASMREGLDVPGPSLGLVVLACSLWPNMTDPLLTLRRRNTWAIPCGERDVAQRQAFGRLLRSASDTGTVLCLFIKDSERRAFEANLRGTR